MLLIQGNKVGLELTIYFLNEWVEQTSIAKEILFQFRVNSVLQSIINRPTNKIYTWNGNWDEASFQLG